MAGAATDLVFFGDNLDRTTNLWASFPCEFSKIKSSSSEATFRVTLASNVPPQLGLVRLATSNDLSDVHLLLVDDLRSIPKRDARKASPQFITAGIALDGATEEMQLDYFTFRAKKSEELTFDLFARRLGSTLDPIVRLLDEKGRELIYSLETAEPNGDAHFRFKAPNSGSYIVELRDVGYHGGANYFYRLRFGHFPLITSSFPPVVQRSNAISAKFPGSLASAVARVESRTPLSNQFSLPVVAKSRDKSGSGFGSVLLSDLLQLTETEPNDKPAQATAIKIPAGLNGRFQQPRDRDYYEFDAAKDDRLVFTGQTRSLGSACDLSLRLFGTNGTQISESANTTASEGALTYTFDKPGTYRLLVEELAGASGADLVYHLDVRRQPAAFALSLETDKAERSTNGFFTLNVSCARDRYDGPITLSVSGVESGATENTVIAAKKTNATLRVKLPDSIPPGSVALARIVGEASIRDQRFSAFASTLPAWRKSFPMLLYPPVQFDGLVWIGPK